jgi:hypothetical protein
MGRLIHDLFSIAFGTQWPFSFPVWAFVSAMLISCAAVLTAATPQLVSPITVEAMARPTRVAMWTFLAAPITVFGTIVLAFTGVGAPIAVISIFLCLGMIVVGTSACLAGISAQVFRMNGMVLQPWAAALVGMSVLRLVRLIPYVGAPVQSLVLLIGFSAAFVVAMDAARSWHARRMPDAKQFEGEHLIEWNAPEDYGAGQDKK